jgi:hypothetical protein
VLPSGRSWWQEWQRNVWLAAERAMRQFAEAAELMAHHIGAWASNMGRASTGAQTGVMHCGQALHL